MMMNKLKVFLPNLETRNCDSCYDLILGWGERGYVDLNTSPDDYIWVNKPGEILLHDKSGRTFLPENYREIDVIIEGAERLKLSNSIRGLWWARHPRFLEKWLSKNKLVTFMQRKVHSAAFFQSENPIQSSRRCFDFSGVIEDYFNIKTAPGTYTIQHEQYLARMAAAKYGACAEGFTDRDNRLVECCALGMCPVVLTPGYNFDFFNLFAPGKHFLSAFTPNQFKILTSSCHDEKNQEVAIAAHQYWQNNWSIEGSYKVLCDIIK